MRQERASVIAKCRADILGLLLLSCLLGVQGKRKEVKGSMIDWHSVMFGLGQGKMVPALPQLSISDTDWSLLPDYT